MTRKAKATTHKAGGVHVEDDGGAWMNDHEGPKMAAFLRRFTSEPKAQAPLKQIIMVSSPEGPDKNTFRLVSKQFKDDAEEGTTSITWMGPEEEHEEEFKPSTLMHILSVRGRNGRFKDRLPNLKSIICSDMHGELDTLMNLNGCPSGLEVLSCYGCKLIKNLTPLAACANLRELDLWGNKVSSLQPLMGCVKLERLDVVSNPVPDLRPLSACINLRLLWMDETLVSDLGPLSGLHRLQMISFSGSRD